MWMLYSQIIVLGLLFVLSAITCLRSKSSWGAAISIPCRANHRAQALLREVRSRGRVPTSALVRLSGSA